MKEVSEEQLKMEIEVYSEAGIDENVKSKLKAVRKKAATPEPINMIHEIADSLKVLLEKIQPQLEAGAPGADQVMMGRDSEPDRVFLSAPPPALSLEQAHEPAKMVVVTELSQDKLELPDWAPPGCQNVRGMTTISPAHYTAVCGLGKGVCDAMLDTAGARTMMDLKTAELLGLDVEKTTASKYFGSFISASAVPTPNAGRITGPVELQFSDNVKFHLKEIKVI